MMRTVKYSWKFFVSFAVIFGCCFVGFGIGFTGGFGDKFERVNSFPKACLFLSQSFVGSANLSDIYDASPVLGGVLIGLFLILIYLTMLNLFMAIMVVALSEAKAQQIAETKNDESSLEMAKGK